jgi:hypothetical protein
MFHLLNRWFGKNNLSAKPRLEKNKVITLAREAASEYPNSEELSIVTIEERSGALIWIVSSATVGRMLQVSVDDASGEIVDIKQVGVR